MKIRSAACAMAFGTLLAASVHADTTYDIAFTDIDASPSFTNANGTFTIDASDKITSFNVSFTVLKAYTFEAASGSPGQVITFNHITSTNDPGTLPTLYRPSTGWFCDSFTCGNFAFFLTETGSDDTGVTLGMDSGANVNGPAYSLDPYSKGDYTHLDEGNWVVTPASGGGGGIGGAAPEPATATLLLTAASLLVVGGRRARSRR